MIGTVLFTVWHPEWDFKSTHSICLCKNVKGSISFSVWMSQSDNGAQGLLWSRPCQLDHGISVLILVTLTSSFCSLIMTDMAPSLSLAVPLACLATTSPELLFKCFPPWLPCKQKHPQSWVSSSPSAFIPYWHTPFLTHLMPFPLRTKQEPRKTFLPQLSQKLHVCLLNIVFMLPWASSFFLKKKKKTWTLTVSTY